MSYSVASRKAAKKALLKAAWAQGRLASATTVHLDPTRGAQAELQQAAIDAVQQSFAIGTSGQPTLADLGHDGAVILASRSLAGWLHDDAFLSRMLAATGLNRGRDKQLNVLAAAVDEVPRYDRRLDLFGSSEGISVLRGLTHPMVSGLWDMKAPQRGVQKAALKVKLPWTYWPGDPIVTVPLANTLFANGKPHVLFGSKWQSIPDSAPALATKLQHVQQTMVLGVQDLGFTQKSFSTVAGHLVPVTTPRKVVGSLGNILSQLEIDGQPAPASKELESVIPRLLEQRRKLYGEDAATGPIGVWALTIPRRYVNEGRPILEPLRLDEYRLEDELRLARETTEQLDWLLSNRCRFVKVLSGGGGWGPKQGLLSLDPQKSFEVDEDESLQTFINSFGQSENGAARPPPRMYVQFFVEAAYPPGEDSSTPFTRQFDPDENHGAVTAVLGTGGTVPGASSPLPDGVSTSPGLFGAISSEGIYLAKQEGERMESYKTTKMDAARSSVICHKGFLGPPEKIRARALPSEERKGGIRVLDLGLVKSKPAKYVQ